MNFSAKMALAFLFISFFFLGSREALADRSEIDRFKVLHDKIKTEDLFRPLEHDFIFDLTARESKRLRKLVKEGSTVSSQDQAAVRQFLERNLNTEHYGNVHVKAGIPLPRFTLKGVAVTTDIRGNYDLAASLSITQLSTPMVFAGMVQVAKNDPFIQLYIKNDQKYGLNIAAAPHPDWNATVYLYYMKRWDILEAITGNQLVNGRKVVNIDRSKNWVTSLNADMRVDYDYGDSQFFLGIEELRLTELDNNAADAGRLYFGNNVPLFRFGMVREFAFNWWRLKPYIGLHKRAGYVPGKGVYGGSEIFLGETPFSFLLVGEKEYFTFNPRFRWRFLQLEYVGKFPIDETTDGGAKTATLHGLNLRISI